MGADATMVKQGKKAMKVKLNLKLQVARDKKASASKLKKARQKAASIAKAKEISAKKAKKAAHAHPKPNGKCNQVYNKSEQTCRGPVKGAKKALQKARATAKAKTINKAAKKVAKGHLPKKAKATKQMKKAKEVKKTKKAKTHVKKKKTRSEAELENLEGQQVLPPAPHRREEAQVGPWLHCEPRPLRPQPRRRPQGRGRHPRAHRLREADPAWTQARQQDPQALLPHKGR